MSKLRLLIKYLILVVVSAAIGFYAWYYPKTSGIVQIALSDTPLSNLNNRTNLLIMGVGGEGHDGSDLTDTIMLISLGLTSKDIKLLSIPRDIWIPSYKVKINTLFHYGSLSYAKDVIGEYLGTKIHYAAVIDFNGFIKLIDIVGGIDVMVDRSFDDYKYPIPGKETVEPENDRYEHLHFDAGLNHMDGVTALKFARSRHAEGDEGTDFARSARQQKIISALKDKIISSQTLLNQKTLSRIASSLGASVDTDISQDLYASFFKWGLDFISSGQRIISGDLTPYLHNPRDSKPYGGAWVLIGDENLKSYVAKYLSE